MTSYSNNYSEERAIIGALLRECREEAGLRQRDLAAEAGTNQATISCLEQGKVDFKWDTLVKVAEAMGYELEIRFNAVGEPTWDELLQEGMQEVFGG